MTTLKEFLNGFKNPLQDIKVTGVSPLHFVKSEWEDWTDVRKVSWPFVAWRVAYLIFTIFAVARSMVDTTHVIDYWFLFVTNWSILLQMVYCILFISNIAIFHLRKSKTDVDVDNNNNNGVIGACLWILFNIVGVAPYFVTLIYWVVIYSPNNPRHVIHKTIFNHGINAVFTFVDTFIVAIPVHVTHVIYLLAYGGVYISFTLLYELCGGSYPWSQLGYNYIYSFLNWREKPGKTVGVVVAIGIAVAMLYYVLWFLYILRLLIISKSTKLNVYKRHSRARASSESIQVDTIALKK